MMQNPDTIRNNLVQLGKVLGRPKDHSELNTAITRAEIENPWFTRKFILQQIDYWHRNLTSQNLHKWLRHYPIPVKNPKTTGIVMAGNIPLVGMHDMISVLVSGHKAFIKVSSKDKVLPECIKDILCGIDSQMSRFIHISDERFTNVDALIATGSNNTARYFDYYFRQTPHIIRKNRNGVAVLTGNETDAQLKALADDVFQYFGMGCRNVSKVYIPAGMDETRLLDNMEAYRYFTEHNKYMNNYVYQKAIMLIDRQKFLDNDFLCFREHKDIASPVAVLHYERYENARDLRKHLEAEMHNIQSVVSEGFDWPENVAFGQSQNPPLNTYADNIDTIDFLLHL